MKNLDAGHYCVHGLDYRLIPVSKYRRDVITDAISNELCHIQSQGES